MHHQRSDTPPPPPPPAPAPPPPRKPGKPADRKTGLSRLAKQRGFPTWKRALDPPIPETAEAIWRDAIAALLAQRTPNRTADRRILQRFVAKFDALDREHDFIGTIEVEDIAEQFETLRAVTLVILPTDDYLFDVWRDF